MFYFRCGPAHVQSFVLDDLLFDVCHPRTSATQVTIVQYYLDLSVNH